MTLVVSVQCSEGIVLAADSAITVFSDQNTYVWPHAKKLSHISKHNIGTLSFGLGAIGERNIQSLMYEFEVDYNAGCSPGCEVSVLNVSNSLHQFLNKKYTEYYGDKYDPRLGLGMIIAGYSQGSFSPEQYRFMLPINKTPIPIKFPNNVGIVFDGLPDAVYRLLYGIDSSLALALSRISLTKEQCEQIAEELDRMNYGPSRESIEDFIDKIRDGTDELEKFIGWKNIMSYDTIVPGMPLQDGIDLATWLIESTIGRFRFAHSVPLVGGPIDIAVITHATYTWIQRKSWHGYDKQAIRFEY